MFNSATPTATYEGTTQKGEATSVFAMNPGLSYFVIDNLSVGVDLSFLSVSSKMIAGSDEALKGHIFSVMPNVSYYFDLNSAFKPYLRAGAGYSRLGLGAGNTTKNYGGFSATGTVGGAYFINKNVALDLGVNYLFATSKIDLEGAKTNVNLNNFGATVGLSFFF